MNKKPHAPNYILIVLLITILLFGLLMLSSASIVIGRENFNDAYYYLKHQLFFGLLPGLAVFLICAHLNYKFWKKISLLFFSSCLVLLVIVLIPGLGYTHGGAKRWLTWGSLSLQPSEIAKIGVVIFFSAWLASKKEKIRDFYYTVLPFLFYLGLIILLIALEPDIGTLSVIVVIALSVFLIAGSKISHLAGIVLIGCLFFGILIKAAPYRLSRITVFLNPTEDTLNTSYQINQSLLAVGSGGILGQGLGKSKQKHLYLPEVAGDSIFAIIAEELGFIFTSAFIICYLYFCFTAFKISLQAPDQFSKLLAVGIAVWFTYQALVNIGAMVNILPLTGLPLPFVSYGSSALIVLLAGAGILTNISKFTK